MSTAWHGGKGAAARSLSVSQDDYSNSWDRIFGKRDPEANLVMVDGSGYSMDENGKWSASDADSILENQDLNTDAVFYEDGQPVFSPHAPIK